MNQFEDLALERPVADVTDDEVELFVKRMADQRRNFTDRAEGEAAEAGDKLTVDFIGKINGETFEGGTATDIEAILGSKSFIPGFEEALIGVKAGEFKAVEARFPDNYANAALAGKDAVLETTV